MIWLSWGRWRFGKCAARQRKDSLSGCSIPITIWGYSRPVGEHLKYLVLGRGQPIACLAWSSAPRHLGPRDRFIGWSATQRRAHIDGLAYNLRYMLLPWVRVPHLASHLLGAVARGISEDWQRVYQHPIYLLETFIDPARFGGTCYRAANWRYLGLTTGRGKDG